MDESLAALAKEVQELRQRQLQDRHVVVERMEALAAQTDQPFAIVLARMDETDKRWNQLIDQLTREHRNGGKKRHN
jgi:hypothetical protein